MKFLNGQACKKPFRKITLVIGIVFLSISILPLLLFLISLFRTNNSFSDNAMFLFLGVPLFIPGLILFIIGMTKRAAISKDYKRAQSVDYQAWRAEHLNNPNDPLFSLRCRSCNALIEYDYRGIDGKRFWFPDGFVVCPKCNTIMRHNVNTTNATQQQFQQPQQQFQQPQQQPQQPVNTRCCTQCGTVLPPNARFCGNCGKQA